MKGLGASQGDRRDDSRRLITERQDETLATSVRRGDLTAQATPGRLHPQ